MNVNTLIMAASTAVKPWLSIDAGDYSYDSFPRDGEAYGAVAMNGRYETARREEIKFCLNCPYEECRNCFAAPPKRRKIYRGKTDGR